MAIGRPRVVYCKRCRRHVSQAGPLSYTKICAACGERAALDNRRQLMAHTGPYFEHWRAQCLAAFGVSLAPRAGAD